MDKNLPVAGSDAEAIQKAPDWLRRVPTDGQIDGEERPRNLKLDKSTEQIYAAGDFLKLRHGEFAHFLFSS
jgi:hypothetical protein